MDKKELEALIKANDAMVKELRRVNDFLRDDKKKRMEDAVARYNDDYALKKVRNGVN